MLKIALKTGLICGLILLVPTIIQIIIGIDKVWINGIISIVLLALAIWLVVKAVKDFRTESDNRITFGSIFNIAITSFLIVSLITVSFTYIHQNYIDPDFGQRNKDMMMAKVEEKVNSNENLSEDQKMIFMEDLEKSDPTFTPQKALKTMAFSIILYLVISLLLSSSIKKNLNDTPQV